MVRDVAEIGRHDDVVQVHGPRHTARRPQREGFR
jgi:hypothetical protein